MREIAWNGQPIDAPGLYRGVSMVAYHAQLTVTPSISSSGQRVIWRQSPAHYYDGSYLNPNRELEEPERPHFSIGRAAHHLLLLGRRGFDDEFVVRPEKWADWRTKESRQWKADQISLGKTVITMGELEDIVGMAKALGAHPMVRAGILDGLVERTICYQDAETGVWVKSRPDAIPGDADFADLKTAASVSDDALQRSITENGYHQQGATVRSAARAIGIDMKSFALVCVQKTRPYCVRIVELMPEDLDRGENQNRVATWKFSLGLKTGEWPGPGEQTDAEFMGLQPRAADRIDARLSQEIPAIEAAKYGVEK